MWVMSIFRSTIRTKFSYSSSKMPPANGSHEIPNPNQQSNKINHIPTGKTPLQPTIPLKHLILVLRYVSPLHNRTHTLTDYRIGSRKLVCERSSLEPNKYEWREKFECFFSPIRHSAISYAAHQKLLQILDVWLVVCLFFTLWPSSLLKVENFISFLMKKKELLNPFIATMQIDEPNFVSFLLSQHTLKIPFRNNIKIRTNTDFNLVLNWLSFLCCHRLTFTQFTHAWQ